MSYHQPGDLVWLQKSKHSHMKKLSAIVFVTLLLVSFGSFAQKSEVFTTESGAIKGYDPDAFFTESKAVKGEKEITYDWNGATWHFATKKNKDLFAADPEKYAPQYGGYCAYGTADGHKAPTETDTWTIDNNKLYFNYNQKVKELWNKDIPGLIKKADEQWPKIKKD
jgi:YHS domain-containing protein